MPVITLIKPQKFNKRINIYLDGEFGFGIDLENFVKLGLKVGQEFTREQLEKIIKKAEFQKILDKLLRFATLRPRSEYEVNMWFKKHSVPVSHQKELLDKLIHLQLLDDEKFAKWWVEQRQSFRPKPKSILYQELRIKGVDKEIIKGVLGETEINEEKMAKDLVDKKMYLWRRLDKFSRKKKISEYLLRKGFVWNIIKKAIGDNLEID